MANQQKTGRPNVQIRIPFLPNNAEIFCTAVVYGHVSKNSFRKQLLL
jgi:hypothetical protein